MVEKILDGLHPSQREIDSLWAKETEKRSWEINTGKDKTIQGDKVFNEIPGVLDASFRDADRGGGVCQ